jgi:hypothetical protein
MPDQISHLGPKQQSFNPSVVFMGKARGQMNPKSIPARVKPCLEILGSGGSD